MEAEQRRRATELQEALSKEYGVEARLKDSRWCQKYILNEPGVTIETVAQQLRQMAKLIDDTNYTRIFGQKYYTHLAICIDHRVMHDVYAERDHFSSLAKKDVEDNMDLNFIQVCTRDQCLIGSPEELISSFNPEMNNAEMRPLNHNSF